MTTTLPCHWGFKYGVAAGRVKHYRGEFKMTNLLFGATRLAHTARAALATLLLGHALAATAAPPPVPDIMHYKFDGTGATVTNYATGTSPAPATATLAGGLTQGATIPGTVIQAVTGTGVSATTDFVNTGWATNLSGSWSISFFTSNIGASSTLFYMFGDAGAGSFRAFTNGVAGPTNWWMRGTGMTDTPANGAALVATTMTTFVYDASANETRSYVNGVLNSTVTQTAAVTFAGSGPFKVAGYSANVGLPLGGLMGDFRMYGRALTATEIVDIYNAAFIQPQTLTFGTAPTVVVGGTGNVTATSASPNSGNPITFSTASTDCSVTSAGVVTGINAGTNNCVITATQAGNASYSTGTATQTISIGMAPQSLTFPAQTPASRFFVLNSTFPVNPLATSASPNSGNAIAYSSLSASVCSVSGTTVTMLAAGTCQLAANQAGNANYTAAPQATQNVVLDTGSTVGGSVSGLAGSGLVLSLNSGAQTLAVSANGNFVFPSAVANGTNYTVTVQTQPTAPPQTCTVANGSGTTNGTSVTNVAVTCVNNSFTVGGTVSGLTGAGLVLSLNGGAQLAQIAANGTFTFPNPIPTGSTYTISVSTQPSSAACTVSNGTGVVGAANVVNVAVSCVALPPQVIPALSPALLALLAGTLMLLTVGMTARRSRRRRG